MTARACDILFVQADNAVDHLPGVRDQLAARGLTSGRQDEPFAAPRVEPGTRVVVVTSTAPRCMLALRQASAINARTALLLDGMTDWRNTLINPRQTESYLRPAGVDLVLCSGLSDARVLRALGNRAAATGLPRIDAAMGSIDHEARLGERQPGPVLVASANNPTFDLGERGRLVAALAELRDEAGYRGTELLWRLTDGLDDELGVRSDDAPLADVLCRVSATICTPSTLLIESMRAGLPTALLHAESTPLWHAAAWVWQPGEAEAIGDPTRVPPPPAGLARWVDSASRLLRQLAMPTGEQRRRQAEALCWLDASSGGARSAELVAEALGELAASAPVGPIELAESSSADRIVSVISVEGACFDDAVAAHRGLELAACDAGLDHELVLIAWGDEGVRRARKAAPDAAVCRMDPADLWDRNAARLRDAVGSSPAALLVHAADTPRLIAQQLALGSPIVTVAHDADRAFDGWHAGWRWSAALATTADVEARVSRHAGARPVLALHAGEKAELGARLRECIERVGSSPAPVGRTTTPSLERLPARVPKREGLRRVVSLVSFEESPIGGVTTFSRRLADAFAARPDLGYDAHTLFVAWDASSAARAHGMLGERASLCVLDRSRPMHRVLEHLRRAVELCEPDAVLPNYTDAAVMVASQLRHAGVRCLGIGHTDDESYRELLLQGEWDGAAAVSDSIRAWLEPLAGDRPCETIVYGVPVSASPRRPSPGGALEIAYIGRVVQPQKRVMDMVDVMRELSALGVAARLHVVGDGEALGPLRRALSAARIDGIEAVFHGPRDAEWVARFLPTVDVSLLTSEAEGTSISMLEAMGAGVVPAVTRVASGAEDWVEHGVSGVVAPIGDAEVMARHLAWLDADRQRIAELGAEAHRRVAATQSIERMAERYAGLLDEMFARPIDTEPSTAGLTPIEPLRWASCEPGDAEAERAWAERWLGEAGFAPGQAVFLPAGSDKSAPPGVEVVRSGHRSCADELVPCVEELAGEGCTRIVIYGLGRHTQWRSGVFDRADLPIVGIIDDEPPPSGEAFGLPVVALDEAIDRLRPDAVLLSSDAWEDAMHARARVLEASGVRVRRIYGSRLQAAAV